MISLDLVASLLDDQQRQFVRKHSEELEILLYAFRAVKAQKGQEKEVNNEPPPQPPSGIRVLSLDDGKISFELEGPGDQKRILDALGGTEAKIGHQWLLYRSALISLGRLSLSSPFPQGV